MAVNWQSILLLSTSPFVLYWLRLTPPPASTKSSFYFWNIFITVIVVRKIVWYLDWLMEIPCINKFIESYFIVKAFDLTKILINYATETRISLSIIDWPLVMAQLTSFLSSMVEHRCKSDSEVQSGFLTWGHEILVSWWDSHFYSAHHSLQNE